MSTNTNPTPDRVASIDAYRGFVMFLMMAEVLHLAEMATRFPDSPVWQFLGLHQTHVEWVGCTLHDMIQPSFSFLVGVSLPFSLASRRARGQSLGLATLHAAWRAVVLTLLGVLLRSTHSERTNFTFEDTLSQIGLGYLPLFLLALGPPRLWWAALVLILGGYAAAFALYPLPGPDFDWKSAGVAADWPYHLHDFAAHWNKNTNPAWAFDTWFLNLFPRDKPFLNNGGGYATLSFLPTLATMILGLIAGDWLRTMASAWGKVGRLAAVGVVFLAAGFALDYFGLCPIVKRIWTPSWVLYSGGWCFILLAGFYAVLDAAGLRALGFPLAVIGANSIAAYVMAHLFNSFFYKAFETHLGKGVYEYWGVTKYDLVLRGAALLLVYWLILLWMYRRKVFVRV